MRQAIAALTSLLLLGITFPAHAQDNALQIEIQSPAPDLVVTSAETAIEVEGMASKIGGVKYIDMMFVMDTSGSLRKTDPRDYRLAGAVGLVENLSPRSDIKIGVVSFDGNGKLELPLTSDREKVSFALRQLERSGSTNIGAGINVALKELEANGRPGASRIIMLFTDGQSNRKKAHVAAMKAHARDAVIQTLLLGDNRTGSEILDEISWVTGGSLTRVDDPSKLPEAFLNLKTTGVDTVTLSVNGSEPIPAKLAGGTFIGELPLVPGENRIVATATAIDGQTRESAVTVTMRDASCGAIEVAAVKEGRPVVSLSDKAVEIVVDASRSMWGRMEGEPKMSVAKSILHDVSYWFPEDLDLALRAYGSTSPSDSNNCSDSTLLVPFGEHNREPIRNAISALKPLGQTPIAYALNQASRDFGAMSDERAVVLVTDGIESCGGDPVQAARDLREQGIVVHLIGFGLGSVADEDWMSLQAVANASGGRYVTAGSAQELKDALVQTVATSYSIFKGSAEVATGSLGSVEPVYLPEGDYRLVLHSSPPQAVEVSLAPSERVNVTLQKTQGFVSHVERRDTIEYRSCEAAAARIERLTGAQDSLQSASY